MENRDIRELENKIIEDLNQSSVIIEAKRLVICNILRLVTAESDKAVIHEIESGKEVENAENIREN